jgi:hypothetical protein
VLPIRFVRASFDRLARERRMGLFDRRLRRLPGGFGASRPTCGNDGLRLGRWSCSSECGGSPCRGGGRRIGQSSVRISPPWPWLVEGGGVTNLRVDVFYQYSRFLF